MISCDTNILYPAFNADAGQHLAARAFLQGCVARDDFCLAEQVLMELYVLLRNPTVSTPPLSASDAVKVVYGLRSNPKWRIVDTVMGHGLMDAVWDDAGVGDFAYGRIFDARLARTLLHHGVTEFATRNTRDFRSFDFVRVWNPL